METCPHCHTASFSTLKHAIFTREGSVHTCPSCSGRAGVPNSPTLALMALTATPALIVARDLADLLFALLAVLPAALALLVWWRGDFSLVAVDDELTHLPSRGAAPQLVPAAAVVLGILALAVGMQLGRHALAVATPEERIRGGIPTDVREIYRPVVDAMLDWRFPYAQMDPSLWTINRQDRYLTLAVKEGNLAALLAMARPGIDVDAPDARGDTPLALALGRRRFDMADALLAAGARLDRNTHLDEPPLLSFARDDARYAAQVAWLIEHGAGDTDPAGVDALFKQGGDYAKALLAATDVPIPPAHAEEARALRQWLWSRLSACGGDAFARDYLSRPYTTMEGARERACR